ncbi:hypothetical protein C0J52_05057 [Blattella germanica]|nr:hypothetical protein C0J52_05057 [Blattella germanica]
MYNVLVVGMEEEIKNRIRDREIGMENRADPTHNAKREEKLNAEHVYAYNLKCCRPTDWETQAVLTTLSRGLPESCKSSLGLEASMTVL